MGAKTIPDEVKKDLEKNILSRTEDGMLALMAMPDLGILNITDGIPAIKAPSNPYYNKDYAKEVGTSLFLNTNAIDYEAACILLKHNYLSDAALQHIEGYGRGHQLLQDNAQFVVDYMFAEHQ